MLFRSHGHSCKRGKLPETNRLFWENKVTRNKERDLRNYTELCNAGWEYLVIWGCEIKKKNLDLLIKKLSKFIFSKETDKWIDIV